MEAKDPTGMLMTEHRLIERVVADVRAKGESIGVGSSLTPHYAIAVADFFRSYADACHHGKEEDILFARLAERDLKPEDAKTMDGLIREHAWARKTTARLADAGDRYAHGARDVLGDIGKDLRALAQFYPQHIAKEDNSFFGVARGYFSAEEWTRMAEEFREFDAHLIHKKYVGIVEELEAGLLETAGVRA